MILTKLEAELSANNCPGYIMDKSYRDLVLAVFPEGVKNTVEISKIPEIREKLKLGDEKELYWISMVEYEKSKDDEKLLKKYELVQKLEDYFISCLQK